MPDSLARAVFAEGIGVFALCFIGILSITGGGPTVTGSLVEIAFAHGLTIAVMVAALAAISGAHFNPAVTVGFVVTGRMSLGKGAAYIAGQVAGGTLASLLLVMVLGPEPVALGTPALAAGVTPTAAATLEIVATFFLVFVIFGTAVDDRAPKGVFPLAIGLTVTLDILAIGPLTGGAMNPARAFGPALASGAWADQWLYWVAPCIGGAFAGGVMHGIFLARATLPRSLEDAG